MDLLRGRYLRSLQELGIEPNFWCSEEYLEKAGCTMHEMGLCLAVEDEGQHVFPPVHPGFGYAPL